MMRKRPNRISSKHGPLSGLLAKREFPVQDGAVAEHAIKEFQLKMLRIQQGLWHSKGRAIILFEGFDAAGKGGCIRRLTQTLDPRSLQVHAIGPPKAAQNGRHYLYRFWDNLPKPGTIAIFDRSWYGRVLVERVENLTPQARWQQAYNEINQFEAMLIADGIDIVKIFLAIHPAEQLRRFEARLHDPYKQWKLTDEDLVAHRKWKQYVEASDELLLRTNARSAHWNLIPADSKEYARSQVLKVVTKILSPHGDWIENIAQKKKHQELHRVLKQLKKEQQKWKQV